MEPRRGVKAMADDSGNKSGAYRRAWTVFGLVLLASASSGCRGVRPTETLVDLQLAHGTVHAVNTEHGILALAELLDEGQEVEFRYHIGNGRFDDRARPLVSDGSLALLEPTSSRPQEGRFAAAPARAEDELYVELRELDGPLLVRTALLEDGRWGDLLSAPSGFAVEEFAARATGCGVWALREGHLQLVGVLNGLYGVSPASLAFVGLDRIAHVLPRDASYFEQRALARRADFEYGVPRDFEGERVHSAGSLPEEEPARDAQAALETGDAEPDSPSPEIDVGTLLDPSDPPDGQR